MVGGQAIHPSSHQWMWTFWQELGANAVHHHMVYCSKKLLPHAYKFFSISMIYLLIKGYVVRMCNDPWYLSVSTFNSYGN